MAMAIVLFVGCKPKHGPTTVFDFEVTVSRVESHKVWLDIFPQDEFLRYNIDYQSVEDYKQLYPTDKDYLSELSEILSWYTDEQYKRVTEEGAYLSTLPVAPDTEYYLVIVTLDAKRQPIDLRKVSFTSAKEHMSSFSLEADSIRMFGGTISIHPADTADTYFWDYELKENINRDWVQSHSVWFFYDVEYYYQMDFFPDMFSKGDDVEDCFVYYPESDIQVGDTICLVAVGYDKSGETSPAYMPFWIIWGGKDSASTVVEAELDGYEDVYRQYFTSQRQSTAKASTWSPSWLPGSSSHRTNKYIPQHIRSAKR